MPGLADFLFERLDHADDTVVLVGNSGCAREQWTAKELKTAAMELAAGLDDAGVRRGDKVGMVADHHDHWIVVDLACLLLGAVDVPRAADVSDEEAAFVLAHAECTFVFAEDDAQRRRIEALSSSLPLMRGLAVMKGSSEGPILSIERLREIGRARLEKDARCIEGIRRSTGPQDLASIVYTSGTTGNPKGVMLTHGNFLHNVRYLPGLIGFTRDDVYLSFLPSWHTFERTVDYCLLAAGARIVFSSKAALRKDLPRVKPTVVAAVPRMWESIMSATLAKIEKLPAAKQRLVNTLLDASRRRAEATRVLRGDVLDEGFKRTRPGLAARFKLVATKMLLGPLHSLADRMVYSKLREALGGRIHLLVSGGGALPRHVDEFYLRAGVTLLNGYGLTETAPVVSVRLPHVNILTTAGRPLAETTWRVMDDGGQQDLGRGKKGVLWIKGPQVMQGYFKNQEATDRVLSGGWFCSGDMAALSDENDVVICGRVKDTIVLRGGENVEPENIEAEISRSPLVKDVLVVGHTQKQLGALVIPDFDRLRDEPGIAKAKSDAELAADPAVQARLHGEVQRLVSSERGFRVFERVPKVALIAEPFSVEAGTLTPTMKKRRHIIEARHAATIAGLFVEDS